NLLITLKQFANHHFIQKLMMRRKLLMTNLSKKHKQSSTIKLLVEDCLCFFDRFEEAQTILNDKTSRQTAVDTGVTNITNDAKTGSYDQLNGWTNLNQAKK